MFVLLSGCSNKQGNADLIIYNANIYTVDHQFSIAEGMAIKNGKILATGSNEKIRKGFKAKKTLDLKQKYIYPGFIDAHCHFYGYGMNLHHVDLTGTRSFAEIIERAKAHYTKFPTAWILGRGWDQNDWKIKDFPVNAELNKVFPKVPVFLRRVDGHGAIANEEALRRAGITVNTKIQGGDILIKDGKLTGVLIDNAMGLVQRVIPENNQQEIINGLLEAQKNCFAVGLTAVYDAGLSKAVIETMDSLQKAKQLKIRIDAWISPSRANFEHFLYNGIYQTDRLRVGAIKLYADGALGSRGAKLLKPYSDDPGNTGLIVSNPQELRNICKQAYKYGYQVNTHCIGDSANRLILKIYSEILQGQNDRRWRIEHAQVIDPSDFHFFKDYSIIPSVQPTHATSDMYWAKDRLGPKRIKTAYAYQKLLDQNGWLPNGSDFPIEGINPLNGFFAAVARKDISGYPENGFQPENALSREEALKAMTIWAAKSSFGENRTGSLEPGKFADFVVLSSDLMSVDLMQIPKIKIEKTFLQGEEVFTTEK